MTDSPFPRIVDSKQRAFLAAFRETGNVCLACEVAKVGRSSHYRWLEKDPEYRAAFDLAKECAGDMLEYMMTACPNVIVRAKLLTANIKMRPVTSPLSTPKLTPKTISERRGPCFKSTWLVSR